MSRSFCIRFFLCVLLAPVSGCSGLNGLANSSFRPDKLNCKFTASKVVYSLPTGREVDTSLPKWSLELRIYSDQVAIRQLGRFNGQVEILPALVNADYVKFDWSLSGDSEEEDSYKLVVDRRDLVISMTRFKDFGGGASSSTDVSGSCEPAA